MACKVAKSNGHTRWPARTSASKRGSGIASLMATLKVIGDRSPTLLGASNCRFHVDRNMLPTPMQMDQVLTMQR